MAIVQDLRFGIRAMRRNALLTIVAAMALAVGIGLNTTAFGLVNAVLIKGLPFEDSHEILHVNSVGPQGGTRSVSYPDLEDWRDRSRAFEGLAAFAGLQVNLSDDNAFPESVTGSRVDVGLFGLLAQPVLRGRDFTADDALPDAGAVVLLGEDLWERRYAGNPEILGTSIRANGRQYVVVGIMPTGMEFPNNANIWFPIREGDETRNRGNRNFQVVGRLADGVSRSAAAAELDTIAAALAIEYPDTNDGFGVLLRTSPEFYNGGPIRTIFLALLGAVTFVLLIACTNVANLQLTQALRRAGETSIRTALGANRGRLVRQMLTESVMLSLLGAVPGLALALLGVQLFDLAVAPIGGKPYWIDFSLDYRVLGYLVVVTVGTAIFFGLVPSLRASRVDINAVLKDGTRSVSAGAGTRRWIGALVIAEVSLTLVLLVGAGVMFRSFINFQQLDLGVDTASIVTARVVVPTTGYEEPDDRIVFQERLLDALEATPGVEAAAIGSNAPGMGAFGRALGIPGREIADPQGEPVVVDTVAISPGFFEAFRTVPVAGRTFDPQDGGDASRVAIVNEAFADRYFPEEDVLGQNIELGRFLPEGGVDEPAMLRVVGVIPPIRQRVEPGMETMRFAPAVYVPFREEPTQGMFVVVRGPNTADLSSGIRSALLGVDRNVPASDVRTYEEWRTEASWLYRVFGGVFAIAALIALVLASAGVFGVTSYSVDQRTGEIGIRMALGATSRHVLWLVARGSLKQLAAGVVIGGILAVVATRVLAVVVFGVGTSDPLTFLAVVFVLTAVALAACFFPARRAVRLDPLAALRAE